MQIYVCVKHVPDTAVNIKVVGESGFDESVDFVMNPYDEYAVEQAVQIKEKEGGEIVVVSVGKEAAVKTIRSALAVGADRGIFIKTDAQFLDSMLVSRAISKVIGEDGTPDLIFTGKQSVDSEGMQLHYRLAAAFDMPVASDVAGFSMSDGKVTAEREIGGGTREVIKMTMPCVIAATKGLNEPRYANIPGIMKAKKKKIDQIDLVSLGLDAGGTKLIELQPFPERSKGKVLEGSPDEMAEQLVKLLKDEAKVL
ncbi:electron transfer flavoprotein subunit beta/FixA family protein [Desulfococcaceae bacterium HSG8]|nr:electron transfer flavoprotein subunit beta/FixA family protein [Desulfococcaceae bacterium HSG8]